MTGDGAMASLFREVRGRALRRASRRAGARLALAALGTVLVALGAGRVLGPRLGARAAAAVAFVAGCAWVAARLRRDMAGRDDDSLARRISASVPELHSDLLSVVQLRRDPSPRFSPALLDALSERTAGGLPRDGDRIVPSVELRRPVWLAVAAMAATLAVAWAGRGPLSMIAGLTEPPPEAIAEPLLDDVVVAYRYPAYTARPARRVEGSDGSLLAPRGTGVTLRGRPRLGARHVDVLGIAGATGRIDGAGFEATWTIGRPGEYRLQATLRDGRRVVEEVGHPVAVEPDEPARVDLIAPADDLEVDGQTSVPLSVFAQDDFGLTALDLVWRSGDGTPTRVPLDLTPAAKRFDGKARLDLDAAQLRSPVTYWVEARDNDTVSGPKTSRSRTFTVRMRKEGDRRENALAAQQDALERAIGHLADRLETAPADPGAPLLHARLDDLVRVLGVARRASAQDRFAPRELEGALAGMIDRLSRLHAAEGHSTAATLRGRIVAELERDAWELDRLIAGQRVEELMAMAEGLRRDRERLSERLAQLKPGDEAARQEMLAELAELEQRLRQLMSRAAELASEVPAEYLSPSAAQDRGLLSELADAREKLARGDLEGARAALEALGKSIEQAMTELGAGEGGQRFAARQRALAEALAEVGKLSAEQRGIADGAESVEQRASGERRSMDEFVNDLRSRTEHLRELLAKAAGGKFPEADAKALDQARRNADALDESLEAKDLRGALGGAQSLRSDLSGRPAPLREPGQIASTIADDLEKALREPPVDGEGRAALGGLSRRQQAAQGQAQSVAERLSRMSAEAPSLEPVGSELREAGQAMGRGAGAMRGGLPRASSREAGAAADRLASLEQRLREEQREMERGGRGMDREPVKVPGAEAYRVPKEWREEILEAMKEGAPEGYREMVRRYYRDLVR